MDERHGNPVSEGFKSCSVFPGFVVGRTMLRPIPDADVPAGIRLQPVSAYPPSGALPQAGDYGLVLGRFREDDL